MPDITGRLTSEDYVKINRWWAEKWKAPVICPVCKTQEWETGKHVVNIQRHATDAGAPFTETYPMVLVACKNCSHTMFFNAVSIGVAPAYGNTDPSNAPANPVIIPNPPFHD